MPSNTTTNPALDRLRVRPIARADAKRVVMAKHYMKTFPQGAKLHFGVFDGRKVVGVCVLGYSTGTHSKVKRLTTGLSQRQYIEMQRLWISDTYGHNTESNVLGKLMKALKKAGLKIVVTHAGGCKNDCGFVYQASAWLYFGREECRDFYLTEKGEYRNTVAALRFGRIKAKGKTPQQVGEALFGPGKVVESWRYLYAYPIDKGIRRRLSKQQQPFPKVSAEYRFEQKWV